MRLVVNGIDVDLDEDTSMEYVKMSPFFNNLAGDFSYPFNLPGTSKNLKIFGNPHLPSSGSNVRREYKGQIWIGSFLLGEGTIRLRNTKVSRAEVTIIVNLEFQLGNLTKAQWFKSIRTLDLGFESIPTIQKTSSHFFKQLFSNVDLRPATNYLLVYAGVYYGNNEVAISKIATWGYGYNANDTSIKFLYAQLLEQLVNESFTINADKILIEIKTESSQTNVKVRFYFGNSVSNFDYTELVIPPIIYTTIDENYFSSKVDNSVYCLPQIRDSKFYSESNPKFNGVLNAREDNKVLVNTDDFMAKYTIAPSIKLAWFIAKLAEYMNSQFEGDFLSNSDIQKLIFVTLQSTDKQASEISIPFNVHASTLEYASFLPNLKIGEFLQALCNEFAIGVEFNTLAGKVNFMDFSNVLASSEYLDLSGRLSINYDSEVFELKGKQLVWENQGNDELFKEDYEIFKSNPTKEQIELDEFTSYESYNCKLPSLYSSFETFYSAYSASVNLQSNSQGGGGNTGGGEGETPSNSTQYTNVFIGVPKESLNDVFSPERFENLSISTYNDLFLGVDIADYMITWEGYLTVWQSKNIDMKSKGIFAYDYRNEIECIDIWTPNCGGQFDTFTSALPYYKRVSQLQMHLVTNAQTVINNTDEQNFDFGYSLGAGAWGRGDATSDRNESFLLFIDIEAGLEDGGTTQKGKGMAALMSGIAKKMRGYPYALYMIPYFTYGNNSSARYPNADGSFNTVLPADDYPEINYAMSRTFLEQFTVRGETFMLSDAKNVRSVEETSHWNEDSYEQGDPMKDPQGNTIRVANHFKTLPGNPSAVKTVNHPIARAVHFTETSVVFLRAKGLQHIAMFKHICDRGTLWLYTDHQDFFNDNTGGDTTKHLPRHICFMADMLIFMSGTDGLHLFDYPNSDRNLDCYNGMLGHNVLLYKKINIGGEQVSLANHRHRLTFNLWDSEVSYDAGATWTKHKGTELEYSPNNLPLRSAYTADGFIVIFACRPYNLEPLQAKWRVTINSVSYTDDINDSDWYSCYPVEFPSRKDYFIKIFKV